MRKKQQVTTTRQSSRISRDGEKIADKAMNKAKLRSLEMAGNVSNNVASTSFSILNNYSRDNLNEIANDCDISFRSVDGFLDFALDSMLAEENLRASVAEAAYISTQDKLLLQNRVLLNEYLSLEGLQIVKGVTQKYKGGIKMNRKGARQRLAI